MAVNEPSPRAQPEDKVCLRSHNSLATSQSLIYLLLEVIGAMHLSWTIMGTYYKKSEEVAARYLDDLV